MRRISVVLPVYEEAASIGPCLRGLASALDGVEHEILVCHDTDEDSTLAAIASMPDRPPGVRLVRNTLGRGALQAIRSGFHAATGDVVVTTMADLSDPPEKIPAMAEKVRAGADVVSGSRYMEGGSQRGGPWLKRTLSRVAGVSLRWITGIGTHDATSNFRAYSREFLEGVAIESRAGFEIALELTVKAHLEGRKVDEVPSSWVERSHGKSNFRLWKWLPSYLRWYLKASLEPLAVAFGLALATAFWIWAPPGPELPPLVRRTTAVFLAGAAATCLLLAQRRRGRTKLADLVHVAIWLHPGHAFLLRGPWCVLDLLASALASAAILRHGRGLGIPKAWARSAVLVLVAVLVWFAHASPPVEAPSPLLDVSWGAALDQAVVRGLRAGVDIVFTFGPLGALGTRAYTPELFWTKLLVWQGALVLGLSILLVRRGLRIPNAWERALFLALLLLPTPSDGYAYAAVLGVVLTALATGASRGALAILGILALGKFSIGTSAVLGAGVILASCARERGVRAAAGRLALFLAVLAAAWWTSGQAFRDLPVWLSRTLELSSAYSESCSTPAPPDARALVFWVLVLLATLLGLRLLAEDRGREGVAAAAAFLAVSWVAFKAGFVRASDHTSIFFGFALVAPYLLAPAREPFPFARIAGPVLRAACAGLCLAGLAGGGLRPSAWVDLVAKAGKLIGVRASQYAAPASLEATDRQLLAGAKAKWEMPRTKAAVGANPIDFLDYRQGLLFLNDLDWRPRPVFQGYLTFTPRLAELNAGFLRSDRAADFVLFRLESIDRRPPTSEDALALRILARDFEPVLAERGFLLLRREPGVREEAPSEVVLEAEFGFGERLDLAGLEGDVHVLELDIRPTLAGRARTFFVKSQAVEAEIGLRSGDVHPCRIVPGMVRAGFLVDPLLRSQADWIAWTTGGDLVRPAWIRVLEPPSPGIYAPRIRARVLRADGLAPRPKPELAREMILSHLLTIPSEVRSSAPPRLGVLRGQDVVVVPAPSELEIEVPAGKHVLAARYGILATDWRKDGATFRLLRRARDGTEAVLFQTHLDPLAVEADQRLKYLRVPFDHPEPATLVLRAEPGPGEEAPSRETVWAEIEIRRL